MNIYDIAIDKQQFLRIEEESDGNPVEIAKLPPNSTFLRMENVGDCLHIIYSIEDEPPDAQWTPEELKRLKARDAPPLEINKINISREPFDNAPFDNTVVVDDDKTTVYDWLGNIIEIKVHSKDKP